MTGFRKVGCLAAAGAVLYAAAGMCAEIFVAKGVPRAVREIGRRWNRGPGYLEVAGEGNFLVADKTWSEAKPTSLVHPDAPPMGRTSTCSSPTAGGVRCTCASRPTT